MISRGHSTITPKKIFRLKKYPDPAMFSPSMLNIPPSFFRLFFFAQLGCQHSNHKPIKLSCFCMHVYTSKYHTNSFIKATMPNRLSENQDWHSSMNAIARVSFTRTATAWTKSQLTLYWLCKYLLLKAPWTGGWVSWQILSFSLPVQCGIWYNLFRRTFSSLALMWKFCRHMYKSHTHTLMYMC